MKSVKVTSGPFHSRGGVTIEVLPAVARRWPNGGMPPATCHPYPTSARRWANGGIPPATCHPYPTSARRSGAIWGPLTARSRDQIAPVYTRVLPINFALCKRSQIACIHRYDFRNAICSNIEDKPQLRACAAVRGGGLINVAFQQ